MTAFFHKTGHVQALRINFCTSLGHDLALPWQLRTEPGAVAETQRKLQRRFPFFA